MQKSEVPLIPVKDSDLFPYREEITALFKSVSWRPTEALQRKSEIDLTFLLQAGKALPMQTDDELSLLRSAVQVSKDRTILSNTTNFVLNALRDAYCFGRHISALYEKSSGLNQLQLKNRQGNLLQKELPEFHDKLRTQSAVLIFAASAFTLYALRDYRSGEVDALTLDFAGIPELNLSRPTQAMQCSLYYLCAYLERSGVEFSDLLLLKLVKLYFEGLKEEVYLQRESLRETSYYLNQHYRYEPADFVLMGFEFSMEARLSEITFNRVEMDEIVANREAKHLFKRYAERLMCFDFSSGRNPMHELGGLPAITMADGRPGTGKSMLIAATATYLKDRCDAFGYPFLFWPLPENIISTYQGGSAERALEWFKPMQVSSKIIFAPIDDAENNLEERTRQGVSAGVREFIGVFLRNTEGAYAINRGNRLISLFTNLPDQIDKAVLSRIQVRVKMDGAEQATDFLDQDYLWWIRYHKLSGEFIDARAPEGHVYMEAQKSGPHVQAEAEPAVALKNELLQAVYKEASSKSDPNSHGFFAHFYEAVVRHFPFFSSRDLRNIQKAVDARITDFDFPEEWWEKPDDFFFKSYDEKLGMLRELTRTNMGGLHFQQIRLQEALNYIETAIRINETGLERRIAAEEEQMYIRQKAAVQLKSRLDL